MTKLTVTTSDAPDQLTMTREFHAPRALVYRAMMEPALIKQWLGGKRAIVVSAEVDARVGGRYRYVFRTHGGHEFAFGGTYLELGPDRVVQREKFDDYPSEATVTTTFTETGGKTTLQLVIVCASPEVREGMLASGMAEGAGESYDALESLLARL